MRRLHYTAGSSPQRRIPTEEGAYKEAAPVRRARWEKRLVNANCFAFIASHDDRAVPPAPRHVRTSEHSVSVAGGALPQRRFPIMEGV